MGHPRVGALLPTCPEEMCALLRLRFVRGTRGEPNYYILPPPKDEWRVAAYPLYPLPPPTPSQGRVARRNSAAVARLERRDVGPRLIVLEPTEEGTCAHIDIFNPKTKHLRNAEGNGWDTR